LAESRPEAAFGRIGRRSELIAAAATPPGRGAIGIVRLSGPGALEAARSFLRLPAAVGPRSATLAWACDGDARLDQLLLTWFPQGGSFTGEESVELSCHGSPYVLERLLELSVRAGARLARPGEFTQRAFLNGRLDLAQAEAVCDLIAARTRLAHRAAVSRLEGGLSRRVGELRGELTGLLALVEAGLDHPDEDVPLLDDEHAASRLRSLLSAIAGLRRSLQRGRLSRAGARIAIVGRPNAGKSSLLNALLGTQRAIVAETPGTTRDTIEESADLGGLETVLVDTAGLRALSGEPADPVEALGMERTRAALRGADLVLAVLDRSLPPAGHRTFLAELAAEGEAPRILVLNKSDLPAGSGPGDFAGASSISAKTGDGLAGLARRIQETLDADPAAPGAETFPVALRHDGALARAATELENALRLEGTPGELRAFHLRAALDALDDVTGRTTTEDVLREIFSRFCVGK